MAAGIALYAGISWLTNIFPMSAARNVDIRPGVVVPIFFGLVCGPGVGFFTGFFGNLLGDLWSGNIAYPPADPTGSLAMDLIQGCYLNWQVGNGLMGLIPGLARLIGKRYSTLGDHFRALVFAFLGVVGGMGFASLLDIPLIGMDLVSALDQSFIPAARINLINAVVLLPILLFNYDRFDLKSADWLSSGLMRRMLLAILVSAALPVALLGLFLTQEVSGGRSDPTELSVKLAFTVAITLLFTIANAGLLAQSISRPLLRLTRAAQLMEQDRLTRDEARELEEAEASDEVARLSQVFGRMAREVIVREERLRQQVQQLRIEIDEGKKARQVAEITETDYFQTLKKKAKEMRERTQGE